MTYDLKGLQETYDEAADCYLEFRSTNMSMPRELEGRLPRSAHILDLGCGPGAPVDRFFTDCGHCVTGVDISERMLQLARINVPEGRFLRQEMQAIDFSEHSFDAALIIYSLFHVPRQHHAELFARVARVLRPGGLALITLATEATTGEPEYEGVLPGQDDEDAHLSFFFSHDTYESALTKLRGAGLEPVFEQTVVDAKETFCWVIVQKTGPGDH